MNRNVLSLLLPVRNEGINLHIMFKVLRAVVDVPYEILVVVDDASDDSIPVVDRLQPTFPEVRLVRNHRGRGVVNALRTGVEHARGEYVLILAVDEIGPVLAVEQMLALADQGCEFVSCTRYSHGGRRLGGSFFGGLLSRLANWLLARAGCVLSDATTGIKLFRRELFDRLDLQSKPVGWAVALEMSLKAQLIGARLGEVPIISIDRLYGGTSTFRLGPWVREYFRWFWWGVLRLRRQPVPPGVMRPSESPFFKDVREAA